MVLRATSSDGADHRDAASKSRSRLLPASARLVVGRGILFERVMNAVLMVAHVYRSPDEFERDANPEGNAAGAKMSFFRHEEIYRSDRELAPRVVKILARGE